MSFYINNTGNIGLTIANNAAFRFRTNDFTVEFFMKSLGSGLADWNYKRQFSFGVFPNTTLGFNIAGTPPDGDPSPTSGLQVWLNTANVINVNPIIPYINYNDWKHIAITRQGTTVRIFIDGALIGSGTSSADFNDSTNNLFIGGEVGQGSFTGVNGYITNFRYVTGTALYTSAFTKPTSPLTVVTGTQLLLKASASGSMLTDSSPNNFTVSNNGVTWSSNSPFQIVDTPIIEQYPLVESQKITYWWTLPNPTNISSVQITTANISQYYDNSGRTAVFSGLTNGVLYSTTMTAYNTAGFAGDPVSFVSVKPGVAPSAPLNVVTSKSGDSVVVSWDPPASDGGSDIQWYALQSTDLTYTFSIEPFKRTFTSTSIAAGTYTFVLYAVNYVDWGTGSAGTALTFP